MQLFLAGWRLGRSVVHLLVDRNAPRVRLARRGRTLKVRVGDGAKRAGSGLRRRSVRISFGDGRRRARVARTSNSYAGPGIYRVVVRARDRAGNLRVLRRKVRIR